MQDAAIPFRRSHRLRTNRSFPFAENVGAAIFRVRSTGISAARRTPPDRPFEKHQFRAKSNSDSLQAASTIETRDFAALVLSAPDVAKAAVMAGWATPHPWAAQRAGWEGFVMIYTPLNDAEFDVVLQLVEGSYSFVTGNTLP